MIGSVITRHALSKDFADPTSSWRPGITNRGVSDACFASIDWLAKRIRQRRFCVVNSTVCRARYLRVFALFLDAVCGTALRNDPDITAALVCNRLLPSTAFGLGLDASQLLPNRFIAQTSSARISGLFCIHTTGITRSSFAVTKPFSGRDGRAICPAEPRRSRQWAIGGGAELHELA